MSGDKSIAKPKSTVYGDIDETSQQNGRYYQREVPPRFLLQKQVKSSIKNIQTVTKKPSKDTSRWTSDPHTRTPSQDHAHSNMDNSTGDGGWSSGIPAKGSGWRKSNSESSSDWGQSNKPSSTSWDNGASGWGESPVESGRGKQMEADGWGHNGHSEGGWVSDEGSSRSQSPGGIVMVVKQTTPSKENTNSWESKTTVGANWKMHTLDTKPTSESEKSHEEVKIREEIAWNKQESCETDSVTHKESETRISHDDIIKVPSSGVTTPTPDVGGAVPSGRMSANSISSLSDVGGAKKGGGISRSASPRKMNKYDSSSNPSLSRGNSLILPRPRKSIAELEGGLESLHNAPSGWGQLPSPDSDSTDKGTEFWGIPPDDLARMTGGEQPPISNGWNGGSHSPHPKGTDSIPDSSSWPATEKQGWGEDKLSNPDHHFDSPSSATPSEPFLSGFDSVPNQAEAGYKTKWNSFDDAKEPAFQPPYQSGGQSQIIHNNLMVKDLLLRYQTLAKLQMGQPPGNTQSYQKSLSQLAGQAQILRQKLLSQAPSNGLNGLPSNHPLRTQVGHANELIAQLKQHMNQPVFSPRPKPQSHTRFADGNGDFTYGMRDMTLSQPRSQGGQSARSVSKLHQIISNQDQDVNESGYPPSSGYNRPTAFSPPFRSSSANSMTSSLVSKPVHQIQEFKPGVPWQPKKNEPMQKEQYFSGPGSQRSMMSSIGQQQQPQNRFGSQQKFMRSQSTDNNYYGSQVPSPMSNDQGWNSSAGSDARPQNYSNSGRSWGNSQRPSRISLPSTPVGGFPEQSGWRQPPTTLIPNQYKNYDSSRHRNRTPMDSDWFPETPTSADPVWSGTDGGAWPKSSSGRGWSQSEGRTSERVWSTSSDGSFTDWQSTGGASKMTTGGVAFSPWLVIRTSSPQLNMQSLRDTCKGFGDIKSFIEGPEFVLVGYGSAEDAVLAKGHIDAIWGGKTTTEVVPDGKMEAFWQQINEPPKPSSSRLPDSSRHDNSRPGYFKWEEPNKALPYSRRVSTPGGSVWSDGGFLSGISSPWSSDFSGTLTSPSTGYQSDDVPSTTATPDERSQGHSMLSTYLPNGLL